MPPSTRDIPLCEREVFHERRHRFCVAVFCLNEGSRIQRQLERMRRFADSTDLIVADGASTDGSMDREWVRSMNVRALLVNRDVPGLGTQMRCAFAFALEERYEGIVVMDGNDKDDVSAIPTFLDALASGFDHVQGSRYIRGGRGVNTPLSRRLGVRLIHAPLVSLRAGRRYTDSTNGFRAYSRVLLEDPRVRPLRAVFSGYELHYYLAIRAARLGYRTVEIPVTRTYPASGSTPTKIRGLRGHARVLTALATTIAGRYDP